MAKKCANLSEIKENIEHLILDNFDEKDSELGLSVNDSLSERLDSMAICLLIVQLEDLYRIEFPIESFSKDDTTATLAEKVYRIWETKD